MEINTLVSGRGENYWLDQTPYGPLKTPKSGPLKHLIYIRSTCHHKRYLFWKPLRHSSSMRHIKIYLEPFTSFWVPLISLIHLIFTWLTRFSEHQLSTCMVPFLKASGSDEFNAALKNHFGSPYRRRIFIARQGLVRMGAILKYFVITQC